mmetsp:Transcript_49983/g.109240  ORF Transcript_49983/g.109240 Transcript_49983/m.109240 type:complete len:502 (-) Transcript_49983:217-1722(-)|eukprot:CAMPEP_0204392192 /NCGR_PEP_ID=MMETSP0469-20131031/61632_1 /ASSEMBLY_ACC=CAM_ASM_000384 /TAXON_ID=2969 /ORGANISM="Oxyrrhis marina" /LENGTH=501 /DNA_ID=CAMNT_0051386163 /DNA_START=61 /DNA_END=1566 /DNA_ORIENTATION=-
MASAAGALGAALDQVEVETKDFDSDDEDATSYMAHGDVLKGTDALAPSQVIVVQVGGWQKSRCETGDSVEPRRTHSSPGVSTSVAVRSPSTLQILKTASGFSRMQRLGVRSGSRRGIPEAELCAAIQEALRVFVPSSSKKKFVKCRSFIMERSWTFAGYHVNTMSSVRQHFGLSNDDFRQSVVDAPLRMVGQMRSGKSGALFWISADDKFIIKQITRSERKALSAVINRYAAYIKRGGKTLLPVICAAFKVACDGQDTRLMVMNNVFDAPLPLDQRFDLKGTTEHRYVRGLREDATGKDRNFGDRSIHVPAFAKELLLSVICSDIEWLRSVGIMDYSLLLGIRFFKVDEQLPDPSACRPTTVHPRFQECQNGLLSYSLEEGCCVLYMGFIDILQMYTLKKKAARAIKKHTIGCIREIDTEPPSYYAARIERYLTSKVAAVDPPVMARVMAHFGRTPHRHHATIISEDLASVVPTERPKMEADSAEANGGDGMDDAEVPCHI